MDTSSHVWRKCVCKLTSPLTLQLNESLADLAEQTGSMIEVSKMAKERGYEMMILNPNGIYWFDNKAHVIEDEIFFVSGF